MSDAQGKFWQSLKDFAASVRCSRKVDLAVAQDALEIEEMAARKLAELGRNGDLGALAAARRDPVATRSSDQ